MCCKKPRTSRLFWEFSLSAAGLVSPPLPQGVTEVQRKARDGASRANNSQAQKQNNHAEKNNNQILQPREEGPSYCKGKKKKKLEFGKMYPKHR